MAHLNRNQTKEIDLQPVKVGIYNPPADPAREHPQLAGLLKQRFKFLANRGVNEAYQKIINFAEEISISGHTDGSPLMLKDLTLNFKKAAQIFIADLKDPPIRKSRGITDEAAKKTASQFNAFKDHLNVLIGSLSQIFKLKPVPESRDLPKDCKGFDARRLQSHVIGSFFENLKSKIGIKIEEKANDFRKAEEARKKAAQAEKEAKSITGNPFTSALTKLSRLFGPKKKELITLAASTAECETAVRSAKSEYRNTLYEAASSIYSRFYGMKVTAYDSTPKSLMTFMRPLSSVNKDLTHRTLIATVKDLVTKKEAALPGIFNHTMYANKSISITRRGPHGPQVELTITPSSIPGKSNIKIGDGDPLNGWNDKIEVLVSRFLKGKDLKYQVRTAKERKTYAEDMVFKPVDLEMCRICDKLKLNKAA